MPPDLTPMGLMSCRFQKAAKPLLVVVVVRLLSKESQMRKPKGLYANIAAKRRRIAKGSGEKMRKPGTKGAPTSAAFKAAAKTAKKR